MKCPDPACGCAPSAPCEVAKWLADRNKWDEILIHLESGVDEKIESERRRLATIETLRRRESNVSRFLYGTTAPTTRG